MQLTSNRKFKGQNILQNQIGTPDCEQKRNNNV